jgi:toxin-antitoxin system PIN domain toxin
VIAVDTNVLVYAHRQDSAHHAVARAAVERLVNGPGTVGVPWPVVHEFLAVVTHPRIYQPATTVAVAGAAMAALLGAPKVHVLGEGAEHFALLTRLLGAGPVVGARVHDARVAAICIAHGVEGLWSADRDFSWFPELKVINPLVG